MIKLEMLRVFRAVAEKGSLVGAADVLGRTPSAISMMLAQLEADIGAPLFETDRKNRLSPLGQLVLDESNRATDTFERSIEAIRRHAASLAGTVRIAAVPSAVTTILPGLIHSFRVERPSVRLEISDVDSDSVRRRIALDQADIGIVSTTPEDLSEGTPILEDDLGILCRAGGTIATAAQTGAPSWDLLHLEDLIANPLCKLVTHPTAEDAVARSSLEARNTTALLSLVRAGIGATILPRSVLDADGRDLVFVHPLDPSKKRQLRKILGADRRFSPAVRAFWTQL